MSRRRMPTGMSSRSQTMRWNYSIDRLLNSRYMDRAVLEAIWNFIDGDITQEQFDEAVS